MTVTGLGATAQDLIVTPGNTTSDGTVELNASANAHTDDLTFAIDGDRNGTIMADEHLATVTSDAVTGYNHTTFIPNNYTTKGEGDYTVYVNEEENDDSTDNTTYPVTSPETFYDLNATVTVDDTGPEVTSANMSNTPIDAIEANHTQTVNVSFSEPIAGGTLVNITGLTIGLTLDVVGSGQGSFWNGTIDTLPNNLPIHEGEDTHTGGIEVSGARDAAGNLMQGSGNLFTRFEYDSRPPQFSWDDISYELYSGFIDFQGLTDTDVGDPDGLTRESYWSTDNQTFTLGSVNSNWNSSEAPDGNVTIRYRLIDDVGNNDSATINITLDNTPPNITVHSPVIDRYMKSNETLTVNYSYTEVHPDSSSIVFNNGSTAAVYSFNDSSYPAEDGLLSRTINLSTPNSTPGGGLRDNTTYNVSVTATDQVDNTGQASVGTVTVDDSPPTLDSAITGERSDGNSTDRHTITVDFIDTGTGLDPASIDAGDFNVSGIPVSSVDVNNTTARLHIPEQLAANATPTVTMNGTLSDRAGNLGGTGSVNATDGIRPELLYAALNSTASTSSNSVVRMGFSEPVTTNGSTSVTINGTDDSTTSTVQELSTTRFQVSLSWQLQTGTYPNITSIIAMTDAADNPAWLPDGAVDVDSFHRELTAGWNMVSVPIVDTSAPDIGSVLDLEHTEAVWRYTNSSWELFDPDRPSNDFTQFHGGLGYLVDVNTTHTIGPNVNNIRGTGPNGTLPEANLTLDAGWALLGQYRAFEQDANTTGAFSTINESTLGPVHAHDGSSNLSYQQIKDPDGDAGGSMLQPGHGYWAYLDNTTTYGWEATP